MTEREREKKNFLQQPCLDIGTLINAVLKKKNFKFPTSINILVS